MVSERELRVIQAFRTLELERKRFLEAVLNGTRSEVRLAAWLLGADLPGEDPREVERFCDRLRAVAANPASARALAENERPPHAPFPDWSEGGDAAPE